MGYYGIAPTPPRAGELWTAVLARLASPRMAAVLGGPGRVKMITDELAPLGPLKASWGRIVIAPVRLAFGEADEQPGRIRVIPFLVRSEFNNPGGGYNVALPLEAAQDEAFRQLHGWTPTGMQFARATSPLFRQSAPQSLPLWDPGSALWYLSSEYRAILAPAPSEE